MIHKTTPEPIPAPVTIHFKSDSISIKDNRIYERCMIDITEIGFYINALRCKDVPGHAVILQYLVSEASPVQKLPPQDGFGELHSRVNGCEPFPQVTLQFPCALHSDHIPSTII